MTTPGAHAGRAQPARRTGARPRILVLTLAAGENELDRARAALAAQRYRDWEHRIFEDLPNKAAHETLQHEIMARADEFDLFLKLDADMVLRGPDALARLVAPFEEDPTLDHLEVVVRDWYSGRDIMGIHAFSRRVRWETSGEVLLVDPSPRYPGSRRSIWAPPEPLVDHSPDPHPYQAFCFGIHRALKAFQRARPPWRFNYGIGLGQWRVLRGTWQHFRRTRDRRLGLAVAGAECVIAGDARVEPVLRSKDQYRPLFQAYAETPADELEIGLAPRWDAARRSEGSYRLRIAPRYLAALPLELWRALRHGPSRWS